MPPGDRAARRGAWGHDMPLTDGKAGVLPLPIGWARAPYISGEGPGLRRAVCAERAPCSAPRLCPDQPRHVGHSQPWRDCGAMMERWVGGPPPDLQLLGGLDDQALRSSGRAREGRLVQDEDWGESRRMTSRIAPRQMGQALLLALREGGDAVLAPRGGPSWRKPWGTRHNVVGCGLAFRARGSPRILSRRPRAGRRAMFSRNCSPGK